MLLFGKPALWTCDFGIQLDRQLRLLTLSLFTITYHPSTIFISSSASPYNAYYLWLFLQDLPAERGNVLIDGWDVEKLTEEFKILTEDLKKLTEEIKFLTEESSESAFRLL